MVAAQPLGRDADAHAVCGGRALGHGQRLALGQLQAHEDERVGARDGVLLAAQVALQHLALVAAQLTRLGRPGARVAQRKHEVAEGWDGELRALVRQVRGGAYHGEGRCDSVFNLPLHLEGVHVDGPVSNEACTGDPPVRLAEPLLMVVVLKVMIWAVCWTKPHKQDAGGGNGLHPVGGHTLVVAGVRRVQVLDAQPRPIFRLPDDDPPWLLHDRGVILQPPHAGGWVSGHLAVQNCCLALDYGDIVYWLQKIQKVTFQSWNRAVMSIQLSQGVIRIRNLHFP